MNATYRALIAATVAVPLFAGTVPAQTVVVGTGDPDIDVEAVQSAVDRGGSIVLWGSFSFDKPPTMHGTVDGLMATVLISKPVTISGARNERGEFTAIHGGEIPFAVEAEAAEVRISGLHFIRPRRAAVFAGAVGGLAIEGCVIENVVPLPPPWNSTGVTLGAGIHVASLIGLPSPRRPGNPGNIHGKVSIVNNEISVSEAADEGLGLIIVSAGDAEKPADVDVSGNTIRNANQMGIDIKFIGGRVRIERNIVTSSVVYAGPARGPISGIHCICPDSYLINNNRIQMADPNGAGIRVRGIPGSGAIVERTISDNDVTLSAPEGSIFGVWNAGIDVRGLVRLNVIKGNRIRGRARVALSVGRDGAVPPAFELGQNNLEGFISSPTYAGKR